MKHAVTNLLLLLLSLFLVHPSGAATQGGQFLKGYPKTDGKTYADGVRLLVKVDSPCAIYYLACANSAPAPSLQQLIHGARVEVNIAGQEIAVDIPNLKSEQQYVVYTLCTSTDEPLTTPMDKPRALRCRTAKNIETYFEDNSQPIGKEVQRISDRGFVCLDDMFPLQRKKYKGKNCLQVSNVMCNYPAPLNTLSGRPRGFYFAFSQKCYPSVCDPLEACGGWQLPYEAGKWFYCALDGPRALKANKGEQLFKLYSNKDFYITGINAPAPELLANLTYDEQTKTLSAEIQGGASPIEDNNNQIAFCQLKYEWYRDGQKVENRTEPTLQEVAKGQTVGLRVEDAAGQHVWRYWPEKPELTPYAMWQSLSAEKGSVEVQCDQKNVLLREILGVPIGEEIVLNLKPQKGYRLASEPDAVQVTNATQGADNLHWTVNGDFRITVRFEPIPQCTYASLQAEYGKVKVLLGGQTVNLHSKVESGSQIELSITPDDGYILSTAPDAVLVTNATPGEDKLHWTVNGDFSITVRCERKPEPQPTPVETTLLARLGCYPNPAADFVVLEGMPQRATVQLFSLAGAPLRIIPSHAERLRIDLRDLPRGIYLLRVGLPSGANRVLRLIVQ